MTAAAWHPAVENRSFVDLHCHTAASFDSLADPRSVMRAANTRGLTHLAITDHDRIDGALRARDAAPAGLTVIVGEECRTSDGDLICLFLERPVAPGRPAAETIAEVRAQGGLVGIPHPFDRFRSSLLRDDRVMALAGSVDWVETYNARLIGGGNERAAEFAHEHGLPGVAVSDAHSVLEVGVSYVVLPVAPDSPAGLLEGLRSVEIVPGRASYVTRLFTPVAKVIQAARGNRRMSRSSATGAMRSR